MQTPLAVALQAPETVRYLKVGFGGAHTESNQRLI
jgi:hypothetical protein